MRAKSSMLRFGSNLELLVQIRYGFELICLYFAQIRLEFEYICSYLIRFDSIEYQTTRFWIFEFIQNNFKKLRILKYYLQNTIEHYFYVYILYTI